MGKEFDLIIQVKKSKFWTSRTYERWKWMLPSTSPDFSYLPTSPTRSFPLMRERPSIIRHRTAYQTHEDLLAKLSTVSNSLLCLHAYGCTLLVSVNTSRTLASVGNASNFDAIWTFLLELITARYLFAAGDGVALVVPAGWVFVFVEFAHFECDMWGLFFGGL